MELLVAFGTHDGENLVTDNHAGMATYFAIYRFSGGRAEFLEQRENPKYAGDEEMKHGDPRKAKSTLSTLEGVQVWASPRFGPNITRMVKKLACVVVRVNTIAEAIDLLHANWPAVEAEYAKGEDRRHLVLNP